MKCPVYMLQIRNDTGKHGGASPCFFFIRNTDEAVVEYHSMDKGILKYV